MRLTEQVLRTLRQTLHPGDTAVDATAGNGHDTLSMAELVGNMGKVIAIDLQADAIEATKARLRTAGQIDQCKLIRGDHATVLERLAIERASSVAAITFNLGYLPGGDKRITTSPDTTHRALEASKALLWKGGLLLVTAYRGHAGGMEEAREVEAWMRTLPDTAWQVAAREPQIHNPERIPPVLWIARKQ